MDYLSSYAATLLEQSRFYSCPPPQPHPQQQQPTTNLRETTLDLLSSATTSASTGSGGGGGGSGSAYLIAELGVVGRRGTDHGESAATRPLDLSVKTGCQTPDSTAAEDNNNVEQHRRTIPSKSLMNNNCHMSTSSTSSSTTTTTTTTFEGIAPTTVASSRRGMSMLMSSSTSSFQDNANNSFAASLSALQYSPYFNALFPSGAQSSSSSSSSINPSVYHQDIVGVGSAAATDHRAFIAPIHPSVVFGGLNGLCVTPSMPSRLQQTTSAASSSMPRPLQHHEYVTTAAAIGGVGGGRPQQMYSSLEYERHLSKLMLSGTIPPMVTSPSAYGTESTAKQQQQQQQRLQSRTSSSSSAATLSSAAVANHYHHHHLPSPFGLPIYHHHHHQHQHQHAHQMKTVDSCCLPNPYASSCACCLSGSATAAMYAAGMPPIPPSLFAYYHPLRLGQLPPPPAPPPPPTLSSALLLQHQLQQPQTPTRDDDSKENIVVKTEGGHRSKTQTTTPKQHRSKTSSHNSKAVARHSTPSTQRPPTHVAASAIEDEERLPSRVSLLTPPPQSGSRVWSPPSAVTTRSSRAVVDSGAWPTSPSSPTSSTKVFAPVVRVPPSPPASVIKQSPPMSPSAHICSSAAAVIGNKQGVDLVEFYYQRAQQDNLRRSVSRTIVAETQQETVVAAAVRDDVDRSPSPPTLTPPQSQQQPRWDSKEGIVSDFAKIWDTRIVGGCQQLPSSSAAVALVPLKKDVATLPSSPAEGLSPHLVAVELGQASCDRIAAPMSSSMTTPPPPPPPLPSSNVLSYDNVAMATQWTLLDSATTTTTTTTQQSIASFKKLKTSTDTSADSSSGGHHRKVSKERRRHSSKPLKVVKSPAVSVVGGGDIGAMHPTTLSASHKLWSPPQAIGDIDQRLLLQPPPTTTISQNDSASLSSSASNSPSAFAPPPRANTMIEPLSSSDTSRQQQGDHNVLESPLAYVKSRDDSRKIGNSQRQVVEVKTEVIRGEVSENSRKRPLVDDEDGGSAMAAAAAASIGETVLHRVARSGFLVGATADWLERICSSSSSTLDVTDSAGYTPLHVCCAWGHLDVARLLLQHGADVQPSTAAGIRPIHDAVSGDHVELVRLLLSYGADPLASTVAGLTPMKMARSVLMTEFLRGHLADVNGDCDANNVLPWQFHGSASFFDPAQSGFNVFDNIPQLASIHLTPTAVNVNSTVSSADAQSSDVISDEPTESSEMTTTTTPTLLFPSTVASFYDDVSATAAAIQEKAARLSSGPPSGCIPALTVAGGGGAGLPKAAERTPTKESSNVRGFSSQNGALVFEVSDKPHITTYRVPASHTGKGSSGIVVCHLSDVLRHTGMDREAFLACYPNIRVRTMSRTEFARKAASRQMYVDVDVRSSINLRFADTTNALELLHWNDTLREILDIEIETVPF